MNNKKDFINLRVFSHYSRFESILKPKNIIQWAKDNNQIAMGICDRMNLFGAVEISKYALNSKIKPIIGCLLEVEILGEIPVFIKNLNGFQCLSESLSKVYIQNRTKFTLDEILALNDVIILSGSINDLSIIQKLSHTFSKDFYLEFQNFNGQMLNNAINYNIPIVFTGNVRYEFKDDEDTFRVFQSIDKNNEQSNNNMHNSNYMRSFDDFPESMQKIEEGFANTINIAKKCNFCIEQQNPQIPKFNEQKSEDDKMLIQNAINGLKNKLNCDNIPDNYLDRLNREIEVLQSKGFSGYFLVTADFIGFAKNSNIPVGPGRGSGAGSLVAYALNITDVDPLEYNLIFERFLNPERVSIPDFDVDFCPFRREEVVHYLTNKYGPYNVVNIITFGTLQTRAVLKDVARVFHVGFHHINNIIKYIPNNPAKPITLAEALEIVPQLKKLEEDDKFRTIFKHSRKLEGLMRNYSKHAAGVIIMDRPVYNVCPLFREEDLVTQFNLGDAEYVGCVKFDLLGLKTLTIIQKTIEMIEKTQGIIINKKTINLKDKKTYDLFKTGNLEGIFQFDGSAGIKESLAQLKPDNIEDLIAMNALYRPGPIKKLPNYIKRKHGKENVTYLHPLTKPILEPTFGIMVYQEQVMDIARICAGYSLGEADILRRAMGKKKPEEMKKQKAIFIAGAIKNGIEKSIAETLFEEMNEFSGYGFNKSHAAPYSIIAYECAYLKANYPKEFLSVCMSFDCTDGEKLARYFYSAKGLNVEVLGPSIQISKANFAVEHSGIRYGLIALKNISEDTAKTIELNQPYKDIYDFVHRNINILNKKTWDSLVYSGSLDCFEFSREQLINSLDIIKKYEEIPEIDEEPWTNKYKQEKCFEVMGFYFDSPALFWNRELKSLGCDFYNYESKLIAVDILEIKKRRTLKDEIYAFVQICDGNQMFDVMIFTELWKKKAEIFEQYSLLIFMVQISNHKIMVKNIYTINEFLLKPHNLTLIITNRNQINQLQQNILINHSGITCNILYKINEEIINPNIKIEDSMEFRESIEKYNIKILS